MSRTAESPSMLCYVAIFLISLAALMLEISLTRFFSVSKWYHLAFMVVSIALFGMAASGSFLSAFPSLARGSVNGLLALYSGLFSLSCVVSFAASNQVPFDPLRMAWDPMQIVYIVVYYIVLAVPFFFGGLCVAVALSEMAERAGRMYFSTLLGSGLGSLLVVTLFSPLSASGVIVFAALLAGFSALLLSLNLGRRNSFVAMSWVVVLAVLFINADLVLPIGISPYKGLPVALRYPNSSLLFTQWNPFSRVDVVDSAYVRYAPGLSYEYGEPIPPQLGITVDGDALNAITHYERNLASLDFTDFLPMALPYRLQSSPNVLVLGCGGGLGVLTAVYHGAASVVAVEINPIIIDVVKNRYREFSGGLYESVEVRVEVSESRSFVRGSNEEYDVIELSLTDNVAASSTGVYALSENYVYTVEAFEDYLGHLSEDGVLSITRWLLPPPREGVRFVSLAVSALQKQGIEHPERHIAVVRSWGTITVILKKSEFSYEDGENIVEFCKERKFDVVYFPDIDPSQVNIYNKFPEPYYYQMVHGMLVSEDRASFFEDYLFDIAPVSDENPFFFHFFKWDKIIPTYESMGEKWQPFVEGGYLVPVLFVQALVLATVLILMPTRRSRESKKTSGTWRILGYFLCLGVGYMFIEVVMIQKFILFLGHPVYAVSAVLFSLLTFSGVGSFLSERLKARERRTFLLILFAVSMLAALYLVFLHPVFMMLLSEDLLLRALVTPLLMAPLGLVMGMPFPMGIRLLNRMDPGLIPWAWSVNGCASVLGSILPVIIALSFGFSVVLLLGSAAYLVGFAVVASLRWEGDSASSD